jgi:hypothetical protein
MEVAEAVCLWFLCRRYKRQKQTQRQYWVHPILRDKVALYPKLREYKPKFFSYFRMSVRSFDDLLELIKDGIAPSSQCVRENHFARRKTRHNVEVSVFKIIYYSQIYAVGLHHDVSAQ